jgi:hypothetical protein
VQHDYSSLRIIKFNFASGDTAIWRARTYGDERLLKKATEIETPSCNKISSIFKSG